jgi:predicted ArsR family transcriptional regulator
MLIDRLRDTLQQHERASVQDLSLALGMTPEALRALLSTLERKGRVHKLTAQTHCGDCCKCNADALDVYAWGSSPERVAR